MDFTRTIQRNEEELWVEQLFDGTTEMLYPLPIVPRKAQPGDWLYTIYSGRVVGRNKIREIEIIDKVVGVGTKRFGIEARSIIHIECPGERAPYYIPRKGHQGIRYDSVPEWAA